MEKKKKAKYIWCARRQSKRQLRETGKDSDKCRNDAVRWKHCTCPFEKLDKVILEYLSKGLEGEN